jgi:DNA phosphorothioation-dependent restriction protein DptF
MYCLINELDKLKESSFEAVENINTFNSFKDYMHIQRDIDEELLAIIQNNKHTTSKKLILLCGNVGDGKSHLLSFFKNKYPHDMSNFKLHNDASESFSPDKTSIQTLYDVLSSFTDINLNNQLLNEKIILAINLGTLTNFMESEYSNEFTQLNSYIVSNNILELSNYEVLLNSDYFESVNFSDFNLFIIEGEKTYSPFIDMLFEKITYSNPQNEFYNVYSTTCQMNLCNNQHKCPVKLNYELFSTESIRIKISNLLIQCIIKFKIILSTRTILNFIYDVITSGIAELMTEITTDKSIEKIDITRYLNHICLNYIFEHEDVSPILKAISSLDPLMVRTEHYDDLVLNLRTLKNSDYILKESINFNEFTYLRDEVDNVAIKDKEKIFYRLLSFDSSFKPNDNSFCEYVNYLYHYNNNNAKNIKPLFSLVREAISLYNGHRETDRVNLFIGNNQDKYKILQSINLQPYSGNIRYIEDKHRYLTKMKLAFTDVSDKIYYLEVDYTMYLLLKA